MNRRIHQMDGRSLQSLLSVVVFSFLLSLCSAQPQLIGSAQPIEVVPGDDVILPCRLEPAQDVVAMTIEWSRLDLQPMFVYLWRTGRDNADMKNPMYRGRTFVSVDELKKGNMSLKLTNVQPSDRGTYTCFYLANHLETSVELIVDDFMVQSDSTPIITGVSVGLALFIVALITAGLLWKKCRNKNKSNGTKQKEPNGSEVPKEEEEPMIEPKRKDTTGPHKPESGETIIVVDHIDSTGRSVRPKNNTNKTTGPDEPESDETGITVDHIDPTGRSICLKNNSNKKAQSIRGWKLILDVNGHQPLTYTFDKIIVPTNNTITVYAKGCHPSHLQFNQLVWKAQNPWNTGEEVTVTVQNHEGQVKDRKHIKLKQSKTNRTSSTHQNSDTRTDIITDAKTGKYISLTNRTDQDVDLLGRTLTVCVENKEPITYTFKQSKILGPGEHVNVWARGCGSHLDSSDLHWQELHPWKTSDKVDVFLSSPTG